MKSLNKEIQKLPSAVLIRERWSTILNKENGNPDALDHVYYILLRATVAKYPDTDEQIIKRLKEAFPPVTNLIKRANGRSQYDSLKALLSKFRPPYYTWQKNMSPKLGVDDYAHNLVQLLAMRLLPNV